MTTLTLTRIKALIYDREENFQEVEIEYEYEKTTHWFAPSEYRVTYCKVLDKLCIEPSDLKEDVWHAVVFDLATPDVVVDCEVETN